MPISGVLRHMIPRPRLRCSPIVLPALSTDISDRDKNADFFFEPV